MHIVIKSLETVLTLVFKMLAAEFFCLQVPPLLASHRYQRIEEVYSECQKCVARQQQWRVKGYFQEY